MTVIAIVGQPRSGKTLLMTIILKNDHDDKNNRIFSNYKLTFAHEILNKDFMKKYVKDKETLINSSIGLDDVHTFMESRISGSVKNRIGSYFMLQTGKNNIDLVYVTHFIGMVDKRLRAITEYVLYPTFDKEKDLLKVKIVDVFRRKTKKKIIRNVSKYFKLYDTTEVVDFDMD